MRTNLESVMDVLSSPGYADAVNGDVESPTGYFALVYVPGGFVSQLTTLDEVRAATGDDSLTLVESGWYIVIHDSLGFVHVDHVNDETQARRIFDMLEAEYALWLMPTLSESDAEERFDDMLDEVYGTVSVAGHEFNTSRALKELSPTTYRCEFADYVSMQDDWTVEGYTS